jgi:hypothetical protein
VVPNNGFTDELVFGAIVLKRSKFFEKCNRLIGDECGEDAAHPAVVQSDAGVAQCV